jgi:hypothetical protein
MITRADLLWLGIASGVSGALIGGLLLGLGLSLTADHQPIGLLILTPAAPVSCVIGWLMARRLAARLPAEPARGGKAARRN